MVMLGGHAARTVLAAGDGGGDGESSLFMEPVGMTLTVGRSHGGGRGGCGGREVSLTVMVAAKAAVEEGWRRPCGGAGLLWKCTGGGGTGDEENMIQEDHTDAIGEGGYLRHGG